MRRVISLLSVAVFLLAAATPVAADATPIDERRVRQDVPLEDFFLSFAAGEVCEFSVEAEVLDGKITYVFITEDRHGNILERFIFHITAEIRNLDSGASFQTRYDSVVNLLARTDGTQQVRVRNDALVWYFEGEPSELGPGLWLVNDGRVLEEWDAEGNLLEAMVLEGEVMDVCAALS